MVKGAHNINLGIFVILFFSKPNREMISQKRSSLQLNYLESNYDKAPMIKCACGLSTRLASTGTEAHAHAEVTIGGGNSATDCRFGTPQQHCCHMFPHHQCHDHEHQQPSQQLNSDSAKFNLSERVWESPLSRIDSGQSGTGSLRNSADHMFTVVSVQDPDVQVGSGGSGTTVVSVTPQHDKPQYSPSAAFGMGQQDSNLGGSGEGVVVSRGVISDYGTRCGAYSSQERCARQKQLLHQQQLMQQHQLYQQRKMDV